MLAQQAGVSSSDDPVQARSAMHSRYGRLLRPLFRRMFGPIHYPTEAAEKVAAWQERGTVVYVARARSSWLVLYFNHVLSRLGLPLAQFVGGMNLLLWQPVERLWKLWRQRSRPIEGPWRDRFADRPPTRSEALLVDMALRQQTIFIALPQLHTKAAKTQRHDYFRALVAAQRLSEKPIYLFPHVLTNRSQRSVKSLREPRRGASGTGLRQLVMLLTPRHAVVRVAEPIDLQEICQRYPDLDDTLLARRVRHELHRRMDDEERVVAGPSIPEHSTILRHILRDRRLNEVMEQTLQSTGQSRKAVEKQVARMVDEIAARYRTGYIRFLERLLGFVFSRIYDGIYVDEPGLARVLNAARKGPVIYCPSHKSHVDYLVLSLILWRHGVTPPHIAAGANLSFFPLGSIFRRSGAFFLRRSFRDDPLYKAVFQAYVEELLKAGTSIEFFLEGTRSRTGKLLMPRFGFLNMLVDGWRRSCRDDLIFVPVSIDYERIIEASSYQRELSGGEKQPEDIGALLKTTKVLRSRYGRVHVQFGTPLSLQELMASRGLSQDDSAATEAWRTEKKRLAYRVLHQVGMACSATPTAVAATALLGHRQRGLSQGGLLTLAHHIVDFLYTENARLSSSLENPANRDAAILEAVARFAEQGLVLLDRAGRSDAEPIYRVPDEKRLALDFHKNALMNPFAPAAVVSRCLLARDENPAQYATLHDDARFLSRLLKREFIYRVDADFHTHFDDTLAALAVRGFLDVHDDGTVHVREKRAIELLAGLLDGFVEAYWVTIQTLGDLRQFPLWHKELATRALERTRRAFLEGTIRRPEASSRTLIDSALAWVEEEQLVSVTVDGKRKQLKLASAEAESRLANLQEKVERYART